MTAQEIYDRVKAHLLAQNEESLDAGGSCAYRGERGLKCAAGILILDQCYSPALEGVTVSGRAVGEALEASGVSQADFSLVASLQRIHDHAHASDWPVRLHRLAELYGLTP